MGQAIKPNVISTQSSFCTTDSVLVRACKHRLRAKFLSRPQASEIHGSSITKDNKRSTQYCELLSSFFSSLSLPFCPYLHSHPTIRRDTPRPIPRRRSFSRARNSSLLAATTKPIQPCPTISSHCIFPHNRQRHIRCKGDRGQVNNVLKSKAVFTAVTDDNPPNARRRRCDFASVVANT